MSLTMTFIGLQGDGTLPPIEVREVSAPCADIKLFEWDDVGADEYIVVVPVGDYGIEALFGAMDEQGVKVFIEPQEFAFSPMTPIPCGARYGYQSYFEDDPDYFRRIWARARVISEDEPLDYGSDTWCRYEDRYRDNYHRYRFGPGYYGSGRRSNYAGIVHRVDDETIWNGEYPLGVGMATKNVYLFRPDISSLFLGDYLDASGTLIGDFVIGLESFDGVDGLEYGLESRCCFYPAEYYSDNYTSFDSYEDWLASITLPIQWPEASAPLFFDSDNCDTSWMGAEFQPDVQFIYSEDAIYTKLPEGSSYKQLEGSFGKRKITSSATSRTFITTPADGILRAGMVLHDGWSYVYGGEDDLENAPIWKSGDKWYFAYFHNKDAAEEYCGAGSSALAPGQCEINFQLQARYGWNSPYLKDPDTEMMETYNAVTAYSEIFGSMFFPGKPCAVASSECIVVDELATINGGHLCATEGMLVWETPAGTPTDEAYPDYEVSFPSVGTYTYKVKPYGIRPELDENGQKTGVYIKCYAPNWSDEVSIQVVATKETQNECRNGTELWQKDFNEDVCAYDDWYMVSDCDAACNCYPGCTNGSACNYDPTATQDDGSCFYSDEDLSDPYCDGTDMVKDVRDGCTGNTVQQVITAYQCAGCYNPLGAGWIGGTYCSGNDVYRTYRYADCANSTASLLYQTCSQCPCAGGSCVNYIYNHVSRTLTRSTSNTFVDGGGNPCSKYGIGYWATAQASGTCQAGTYTFGINCCVGGDYGNDGYDASGNPRRTCYLGSYGGYDVYFNVYTLKNFTCNGCIVGTGTLTVTCDDAYCP